MGENVNIVKRSRSSASEMYWKPLLTLADDVVVGDEDVVEEDLVGALVAHASRSSLIVMPGLVERDEEERDAVVLVVGVGAGAEPVPLGEVGRGGPGLLAVEHPAVAVAS